MTDWQDIETAPPHTEVDVYRDDAGVFVAIFTCLDGLVPDSEIADLSEDEIFENDWWSPTYDSNGAIRVSNDGLPTHWMPRPAPPKEE